MEGSNNDGNDVLAVPTDVVGDTGHKNADDGARACRLGLPAELINEAQDGAKNQPENQIADEREFPDIKAIGLYRGIFSDDELGDIVGKLRSQEAHRGADECAPDKAAAEPLHDSGIHLGCGLGFVAGSEIFEMAPVGLLASDARDAYVQLRARRRGSHGLFDRHRRWRGRRNAREIGLTTKALAIAVAINLATLRAG